MAISLQQFLTNVDRNFQQQISEGAVEEAWRQICGFNFSGFIGNHRELITGGLSPRGYNGNALHLACYAGDPQSVQTIVHFYGHWGRNAATQPDILTAAMNAGQSPMHLVVRMDGLVSRGQRVTANVQNNNPVYTEGGQHSDALTELLLANAVDQPDYDRKYALYYACKDGKTGMVKQIVANSGFEAWDQAVGVCVDTIVDETAGRDVASQRALDVAAALDCLLDKSAHVYKSKLSSFFDLTTKLKGAVSPLKRSFLNNVLRRMEKIVQNKRYDNVAEHLSDLGKRANLVNGFIVVAALFATLAYPTLTNPKDMLHASHTTLAFYFCNNACYFFAIASIVIGIFLLLPYTQGYFNDKNTVRMVNLLQLLLLFTVLFGLGSFGVSYTFLPHAFWVVSVIAIVIGGLPCLFGFIIVLTSFTKVVCMIESKAEL